MKKNNTIDFAAWGLVLVVIVAVPLIVSTFYTAPELGPAQNPSVMVMVLTFLGFIALTTLALWGQVIFGRTRSISDKGSLSSGTLNTMNIHNKLIGGLFIVSGFIKLQDPLGFSYKLDDYWDVFLEYTGFFPAEFFHELSIPLAMFISVFEVVLAFALMTGYKMRITSLLAFLMMLFFTFLTGFAVITNSVTDCGCFGDALKLTPLQSFEKDILLTLAILPIYMMRKRMRPYYRNPVPLAMVVISALGFGYISYYTLNHLPCFDFRGAYTVGQDLNYNSTNFNDEDEIIAHDFYDFCTECGKAENGLEGATLYIVCYGMDKHNSQNYLDAIDLTRKISKGAPGIKVCSGTDVPGSERSELKIENLDELCLSSQDSKMLKTMVRSSPGYILLKDGVIQQKWHYNDMPDVEELIELSGPAATQAPPAPKPEPMVIDSASVDSVRVDSMGVDSVTPAPADGNP